MNNEDSNVVVLIVEDNADMRDYLSKPFSPIELRARVQNLIRQREILRKRFSKNVFLQPKDIAITSIDEQFLQNAIRVIEENMDDFDFGVEAFVRYMDLDHQYIYRKLKVLVNQSPSIFIRSIRLRRAAQLLEQPHMKVAEAMYAAGLSNHAYFSQQFKAQFGKTPSEYINLKRKK